MYLHNSSLTIKTYGLIPKGQNEALYHLGLPCSAKLDVSALSGKGNSRK